MFQTVLYFQFKHYVCSKLGWKVAYRCETYASLALLASYWEDRYLDRWNGGSFSRLGSKIALNKRRIQQQYQAMQIMVDLKRAHETRTVGEFQTSAAKHAHFFLWYPDVHIYVEVNCQLEKQHFKDLCWKWCEYFLTNRAMRHRARVLGALRMGSRLRKIWRFGFHIPEPLLPEL